MKIIVINNNKDFSRAYSKGRACGSSVCLAYFRKNGTRENRLGISTPRKVGNAVQRSRARRVVRAAYAAVYESFPKGYDIVVCAREATAACKSTDIQRFFENKLIPSMKRPDEGSRVKATKEKSGQRKKNERGS